MQKGRADPVLQKLWCPISTNTNLAVSMQQAPSLELRFGLQDLEQQVGTINQFLTLAMPALLIGKRWFIWQNLCFAIAVLSPTPWV